ncbi:MAG: 5-methyltetrahydropteroyltriglutamate--homocysteine S-methyltransferase [Bacteroidetes bacterium]|nr:MAG: 5-methyltetrahydropteroyltriglutamate--homocysteine S-methyltransferase [Bacteroidota bacterium]
MDFYFSMCRGYQKDGMDVTPLEMTKWFDTNYHYLVPEFENGQTFSLAETKAIDEFIEAKQLGIQTKPVLIGPFSFLKLGKEKSTGFNRMELIHSLLPVYLELIGKLEDAGASCIQIDEPCLVSDLTAHERNLYKTTLSKLFMSFPKMRFVLASYFEGIEREADWISQLPLEVLHLDLVRDEQQLDTFLEKIPSTMALSLGIVDGRNIWKNKLEHSLQLIKKAKAVIGPERIILAPSCSLLHVPYDLENEHDENGLPGEVKERMAFARQKVHELVTLKELLNDSPSERAQKELVQEKSGRERWKTLAFVQNQEVQTQVAGMSERWNSVKRDSPFRVRIKKQQEKLKLPAFPTTMIGSLPQTTEVRKMRRQFINEEISAEDYTKFVHESIRSALRWQEEIGIDVPVHGEFERNDMVEFFGERLNGFAFTQNGWVQSYGSRGVKPPVIYGDVSRKSPMTVEISKYAQSLTTKPVKGMLTGPVTILQWSFVRDDQPRKDTTIQIALAIRDEVLSLEEAGLSVIQIDEPALREGLPIQLEKREEYLKWAVDCFKLSHWGVKDETQIHTHMCYAEFNDIMPAIIDMDADVISIETSRSQMELLDVFAKTKYPNQIGPGVYDIHSPRIPAVNEMTNLLYAASRYIDAGKLWVNPDCGLKTRKWEEVKPAIENMVAAAGILRKPPH